MLVSTNWKKYSAKGDSYRDAYTVMKITFKIFSIISIGKFYGNSNKDVFVAEIKILVEKKKK